jgi:hypothetical protein
LSAPVPPSASADPLAAIETVFKNNLSYNSDDTPPVVQWSGNNGLDVQVFPYDRTKQRNVPLVLVGPLHPSSMAEPFNIGNTPNSRWQYTHIVECHLYTQRYQDPNISGYNGYTKIWESIRRAIVQNQTTVDGSNTWYLLELWKGPYYGPDTQVAAERYDIVFILKLYRQAVN